MRKLDDFLNIFLAINNKSYLATLTIQFSGHLLNLYPLGTWPGVWGTL